MTKMARSNSTLSVVALILLTIVPSVGLGQSPKLIIRNAHIMTMADSQRSPIDGYISVAQDGTILTVASGEPPADLHAATVVDAHGDWMIPGFISSHSHFYQAAIRGLAQDKNLLGWIADMGGQHFSKATPDDFYWFTLYGSIDHLAHGITSVFDFASGGRAGGSNNAESAYNKAQFRAELDSGIRFEHAFSIGKLSDTYTLDQARTRLKAFLEWTATQPPSSHFLSVMISGTTGGGSLAQESAEAAMMKEFHLGNETHYLESPENEGEQRARFHDIMASGVMSPTFFFGHFIHTDDYILQQTAKAGAGMSWQPLSNGRLASGTADIPKYLKMGIRVGMGVDGEASADLADPFENMRTGLYAIRDKYENAGIMSPYQVLYLHTMGSADVMGIKDKVGSLERGKFADLLLINPARLGPVLEDPYANLVFVAGERDIDSVYLGGDLMAEHNHVLHHDLSKIEDEVYRRVLTLH